jgi:hypothetical protein
MIYKELSCFGHNFWLHGIDIPNEQNTIFLAGTGRSGTTWVSNVINYRKSYREMFEPFRPKTVPEVAHFKNKQYIRPDSQDPRFLEPVKAILAGRISNWWVDQYNTRFFATRRLIKDIRANLFLKWLHTQFPKIPIVLLLRHPCAVALSKRKLKWQIYMETFLSQPELMEDYLEPFAEVMACTENEFDKHVLDWCIETYVPLKQFKPGEIHLIFYENFCLEPEQEARRLFQFLGIPYDPQRVQQVIRRPSELSQPDSPIQNGGDLVSSWMKHITPQETQRAIQLLRLFGLDQIYGSGPLPCSSEFPTI